MYPYRYLQGFRPIGGQQGWIPKMESLKWNSVSLTPKMESFLMELGFGEPQNGIFKVELGLKSDPKFGIFKVELKNLTVKLTII